MPSLSAVPLQCSLTGLRLSVSWKQLGECALYIGCITYHKGLGGIRGRGYEVFRTYLECIVAVRVHDMKCVYKIVPLWFAHKLKDSDGLAGSGCR